MVRIEATADDSLAAMRARSKFGIAIAAMIRMMATTISSSISEKPFCLRISVVCPLGLICCLKDLLVTNDAVDTVFCTCSAKNPGDITSGEPHCFQHQFQHSLARSLATTLHCQTAANWIVNFCQVQQPLPSGLT